MQVTVHDQGKKEKRKALEFALVHLHACGMGSFQGVGIMQQPLTS